MTMTTSKSLKIGVTEDNDGWGIFIATDTVSMVIPVRSEEDAEKAVHKLGALLQEHACGELRSERAEN